KVFAGHSLHWPVLGSTQTVSALARDQMQSYFASRYGPSNMVLIVAGAIDPSEVVRVAKKRCGDWPAGQPRPMRAAPKPATKGVAVAKLDRFKQQAIALVYPAPGATHDDDETSEALAAIVGGQNSRFFWKIVQAGIAPVATAFRVDYCDNGLMFVYGFCEPPNCEKLVDAIHNELVAVAADGVKDSELQRVKNRRRTALATEAEAPYHRLMQLAHDVDMFGRPRSVEERLAGVDAVTTDRIQQYLKRWPMNGDHYLVSVGPRAWP